jgi:hypothetical protein
LDRPFAIFEPAHAAHHNAGAPTAGDRVMRIASARGPSRRHVMKYVEQVLQPGETVIYATSLHWLVYLRPILLALLAVLSLIAAAGRCRADRDACAPNHRPAVGSACPRVWAGRTDPPEDDRTRRDGSAGHLQDRHPPASQHGSEPLEGLNRRCRPVDPRPHPRLRHGHRARHRRQLRADRIHRRPLTFRSHITAG